MVRNTKKQADDGKKPVISFYTKDKMLCPVCRKPFAREEMLSGGGRMIAGNLTDELHRIFEPSAKYGTVYPLIYAVGACPVCHTALLWNDFKTLSEHDADAIMDDQDERHRLHVFYVELDEYILVDHIGDGACHRHDEYDGETHAQSRVHLL